MYDIAFTVEGYGLHGHQHDYGVLHCHRGRQGRVPQGNHELAKHKQAVEDMQEKREKLGIQGVFPFTSLMPG